MRQRRFHEGFQAVGSTHRLRFGMVKGAEIAKRLEKFRGQDQRQEPGGKRDRRTVVAKVQRAEVGETKVNRHQRNRQGGEKFKYARREKGHAQHFHGALTKILRRQANVFGFRFTTTKDPQGFHAAQPVQEMAA